MEKIDKRVAGSLTRFYVVALIVVGLLTMSGLYLIRKTISSLTYDGRVVNVAGRQRMLSQRLTKLAVLKIQGIPHSDAARYDSLLNVWKNSQMQLAGRTLRVDGDVVVWKSARLELMFEQLKPVFDQIYLGFTLINNPDSTPDAKEQALAQILKNEPVFLEKMNEIVFQFDKESYERLKNLERIEWIIDIMTILVLLAEGLLIFRPVVNTTRRVVRMLTESEEALKLSNQKLNETNRQLTLAQTDLIRVEEEKYQLQRAEERVRTAGLIEGQEEERKRFARELHDGIGQMLTGLKLNAEKLKQTQFQDEKQRQRLDHLVTMIQDTIQTTRQVSYNLMPSVLSDFGLRAALVLLCEQTSEASGKNVTFEGNRDTRILMHSAMEIGLYRIAQEGLNNALKHAASNNIWIKLEQNKNHLILEIGDDGKGFLIRNLKNDVSPGLNQNGIENIRVRTQLLNGNLEIISKIDSGTRLIITVDLQAT
jgi:signal transduction histidine kinase